MKKMIVVALAAVLALTSVAADAKSRSRSKSSSWTKHLAIAGGAAAVGYMMGRSSGSNTEQSEPVRQKQDYNAQQTQKTSDGCVLKTSVETMEDGSSRNVTVKECNDDYSY